MWLASYASRIGVFLGLALGAFSLSGCSSNDSAMSLGATPGGAQDEGLAEEKIFRGDVPNPEDITVEGMLASHDLPLDAPSCDRPLCINSAFAVAPTLDAERSAVFVQMGFTSGFNRESFRRDPLNLSVVIDRSGSMAGEKIAAVKTALGKLVRQLDERDRLSIVLFDDRVDVLQNSTLVADPSAIQAKLSNIVERGATNLSAGLKEGFAQVMQYSGATEATDRVIVFTDAIANTGSTDIASFVSQASAAADQAIGLTVFGVGVDLNQELVLAISRLRGGNYAYLADANRIATIFDQDFDYLVTPLAYDLKFRLTPASSFTVSQVYGYPSWTSASEAVEIDVATVFLSRGHGAIVARLSPKGATWPVGAPPLASLSLSYEPADGSELQSEIFETLYDGHEPLSDSSFFWSQLGVRRTVAYVNAAIGENRACSQYWDWNPDAAVALLDKTEALLLEESSATEDAGLASEAKTVAQLRSNMQENQDYRRSYVDDNRDGWPSLGCRLSRSGPGSLGDGRLLMATALLAMVLRRFWKSSTRRPVG